MTERLTPEMVELLDSRGDSRLHAYWFMFDSTGNEAVDRILAAVALAGKMAHSTEWWNDDDLTLTTGQTLVDLIQTAANDATATEVLDD